MSESSSKSSQPLASKQEKDGTEKRGRGRPRKQPPVSPGTALVGSQKEPSEVPTPKRPRGRPKGSKNKGAAKTRVRKLPQLQGGNHGADPRNWRRRKRGASPRSPRRRSSDHAQCRLLLGHQRSSLPPGLEAPLPGPPPAPHCTLPHQLQALRPPGSRIWLSPCALLPSTPALSRQG
ncbi:high mobility group protein HMG-I/HMG-Y isoform X3 [Peromyscus leucopus]|uniref:high mobility group protein HMG-I/HMG-Y isoform X3 n=1 Tax=Peromyscus leucopus TaxID=10041 RepID=UPI0018849AF1|nr:high mobility group protein HMG-I/HMG-Y isoform X3 [Peromyscus leucopus]